MTFFFNAYRPPAETEKRIEDLAENTGRVIDQFDVGRYFFILEPWLTIVV